MVSYGSPMPASSYVVSTPVMPNYSPVPHRESQQFITSCLPKLTPPTFSEDPLTWQTFWDSFYMSIHANPNLSGIQKFNYFKAQL